MYITDYSVHNWLLLKDDPDRQTNAEACAKTYEKAIDSHLDEVSAKTFYGKHSILCYAIEVRTVRRSGALLGKTELSEYRPLITYYPSIEDCFCIYNVCVGNTLT